MRSLVMLMLSLTLLVPALTGCAEMSSLPVIGEVVQSLSGVTGMLAPLKDVPIVGSLVEPLLPKKEEDTVNPTNPSVQRVRRRMAGTRADAANSAQASASAVTGKVDVEATYAALTQKNKQFDRLRTWGLMQLYAGQTAGAVSAFKKAQALRPSDPQIIDLISRCEHPEMFMKEGAAPGGSRPAIPQPNLPDGMGMPNLPGNLPSDIPVGQPNANAAPAGDKPGGLF